MNVRTKLLWLGSSLVLRCWFELHPMIEFHNAIHGLVGSIVLWDGVLGCFPTGGRTALLRFYRQKDTAVAASSSL